MMVTFGADTHKRSHTVVAVDQVGVEIASVTVAATSEGHLELVQWAARFELRRWAIEDCRQLSRRLEADLLAGGESVVRVSPKLMAGTRRSVREAGKSDPIDALAVARAALREPDLPVARLDGPSRELKLLVDYRESLLKDRTAAQNRLRWRLHELEPGYDPPAGALSRFKTLDAVDQILTAHTSTVAELGRREVARIRELIREANQLHRDITTRVTQLAPTLVKIYGCAALTAAKLVGEAADITRFKTRDAYAMWTGTPPIPVWSGHPDRFRLNRGGNRQTNAALYRIAITQIRGDEDAQRFMTRRLSTGDTKREAIRALKRRLSNVVYRAMLKDTQTAPHTALTQAA